MRCDRDWQIMNAISIVKSLFGVYLGSALGTSVAEGQQFDEYGAMWISDGLGGVPRAHVICEYWVHATATKWTSYNV